MNKNNKIWKPVKDIPNGMYVTYINDNLNFLLIGLTLKDIKLELVFEDYYGYRVFNESYRLNTLNKEVELSSTSFTAYVSDNSDFLDWFSLETYEIYKDDGLLHYFIGTDEIVEVLSISTPIIKYL